MSIFKIAWNKTLESLLSSSIPKLKTNDFSACSNVFAYEIDTNGWLCIEWFTFLVGSNSLRIYLAMIELLPTFWSPTNTILNFWIELRLLEKLMLSLIFVYNQTINNQILRSIQKYCHQLIQKCRNISTLSEILNTSIFLNC